MLLMLLVANRVCEQHSKHLLSAEIKAKVIIIHICPHTRAQKRA